jgi:hypothetical protein
MDFDGLASGPAGVGGTSGVSGLLDHGGASLDAGSAGGSADGGTGTARNLIVNPGFEEGASRWITVGGCRLDLSSDSPHAGNSCLFVYNRSETWQGPGYDLTGLLRPSASYRATVWARTIDDPQTMQLTYKHRCEDDADDTYMPFGASRVTAEWTELSASFVAADCAGDLSLIYVEGPAAEGNFYIDDTSVVLETP